MKTLYLIGGTMGVGKTSACRALQQLLPNSVFLDGDWCWNIHPFQVTEETKALVLDNICYLLNRFLRCSLVESVIFCWVMDLQSTLDEILSRLDTSDCRVKSISLVRHPEVLLKRLQKDVDEGLREPDILERAPARLSRYGALDTVKLDVSASTPQEVAMQIAAQQTGCAMMGGRDSP